VISLHPGGARSELATKVRQIALEVAARHAADVDVKARFPAETFAALRQARLLSAVVPRELGGEGANLVDLASMCMELAQGCSSSAMVLAMHHIQVACISRHALETPAFHAYLQELVDKQFLIASVTSEVGVGGDMRSSMCALTRDGSGDRYRLEKDATTVSYGESADDLLVTCRRNPEAPPSDQVLVLLRKGDYTLARTTTWDTLGMRGTCSPGYTVSASIPGTQVLPGAFGDSSAQTMVSYSHVLWSSVWLGIAAAALSRAATHVRAKARKTPGTAPPHAGRLAEVYVKLQAMRNNVVALAHEFDSSPSKRQLLTVGWALKLNNLKITCSEAAPAIIHDALRIIGIEGYKNDSRYSVARHLRDALSGTLMISNDRVMAKNASMLLVYKDE
jgi:acyl-CoA dehydrogenase